MDLSLALGKDVACRVAFDPRRMTCLDSRNEEDSTSRK